MLTYAIGDVHGCHDRLVQLLDRCSRHSDGRPHRLIFVGDYIDRGPDSRGVLALLMALQQERRGDVICLRGNHEVLLLEAVGSGDPLLWLMNGAAGYLAELASSRTRHAAARGCRLGRGAAGLVRRRRAVFRSCGQSARPLDQQTERDQVWIREPFLSSGSDYGRLIVHGHAAHDGGPRSSRESAEYRHRGGLWRAADSRGFTAEAWPVAFLTDDGE